MPKDKPAIITKPQYTTMSTNFLYGHLLHLQAMQRLDMDNEKIYIKEFATVKKELESRGETV